MTVHTLLRAVLTAAAAAASAGLEYQPPSDADLMKSARHLELT